ncbi:MAG: circularly permuted type 2 ATP-grasp protein, partial [Acidimicrobiales bacterium]
MGDFMHDYPVGTGWDEMFDATGDPRTPYKALHEVLQSLSADDFASRCAARDHAFRDQGITFSQSGEERPFPLDLVPRILSATIWPTVEAGVDQRVRALEAFLADVYSRGKILDAGVVPRSLINSCDHFHREAAGIEPPNGVRVLVAGIDLVRGADGEFRVLEDNLRTPSGVSYVVENRRVLKRVWPQIVREYD